MDAGRKDGFLKNLIQNETKETINQLKSCLEKDDNTNDLSNSKIYQFINLYLESVGESETEATNNVAGECSLNDEEILNLIEILLKRNLDFNHRTDGSRSVLEQWQKSRAFKNEEFSVQFRETGNENLRNGQWNNALHFYSEAVLFAPPKSTNISLAFANRAVVLFKVKEYKFAIEDINAAITTEKYPPENIHKLYQRLAKSHELLLQFDSALISYMKLLSSLKQSKLTKTQKLQIKNETEKSMSFCKKAVTAKNLTTISSTESHDKNDDFPTYKACHSQLENASDAVKVMYTPERGRFLVASRDIDVGECITHEEAIVSCVKMNSSLSHCYNCQKDTRIRPIPCDRCAAVVFCSFDCKSKSEFSHRHDCQLSIYDLYLQHGTSGNGTTYLMFLAYKSISQKPLEFFRNLCKKQTFGSFREYLHDYKYEENEEVHTRNSIQGQSVCQNNEDGSEHDAASICNASRKNEGNPIETLVGKNEFQGYDTYFNMVTHINSLSSTELCERVITALFLLRCLEETSYFNNCDRELIKDVNGNEEKIDLKERVMIAGLLFHAYSVILSNSHGFHEINTDECRNQDESSKFTGIPRVRIGNGMFPKAASMINHSCDPNTTCIYVNGKTQVTIATRCISKGEEINHIYQCHFANTPKQERQEVLESIFHFKCGCLACQNDFPIAKDLNITYSDVAANLSNKDCDLEQFCDIILKRIKLSNLNQNFIYANKSIIDSLRFDIERLEEVKCKETLRKIFDKLDKCNENITNEIKINVEKQNVENCLQLYYEKQRLANIFLRPPHGIFVTGRGAISDCLQIQYGNISFGTSRKLLFGSYN